MRDRERANRGGRADRRLVRLGRCRRRCDGREGPQRGFFLDRRGSGGRRGGGRLGRRRRQLGFFSFRRCSRRRGYFIGGSEGDRSRWWQDGRRSRQPGLYSGWRRVRQRRLRGRRRGRQPGFHSDWRGGDGRRRSRRRGLLHRRERLAAAARLARQLRAPPLRVRRLRAQPRSIQSSRPGQRVHRPGRWRPGLSRRAR